MSTVAIAAFFKANPALLPSILLIISEALGTSPKVKSNGIIDFVLTQLQSYLKASGGKSIN